MSLRKTLDFLPSVFRTDTNKKFLSATLDQLVSEPSFVKLNGYVGRKFAPTYTSADSYLTEPSNERQNYQLEPSLIVKDKSNQVTFYSSYTDLINKISYYGGVTNNHNRLFSSEYYSYSGLIDIDKFVNFNQYYWLPNGPQPVTISSLLVKSQATFTLKQDLGTGKYQVVRNVIENPELVVVRGGFYKFTVNQPGSKLWIQTEPGTTGKKRLLPTVSSREVQGVINNGVDVGQVSFRVPLIDEQDSFLKMPMLSPIDYAVSTSFSQIDGARLSDVISNLNGFDGIITNPNSKFIIFLSQSTNDADWTRADTSTVNVLHRRGVWRIRLTQNEFHNDIINLDYIKDIAVNNRIYSRIGLTHANKEFYKDKNGNLLEVPALTAQLSTLYYQDESNPDMYGQIKIVNTATDTINVDESIIGKLNYTSPSGVIFTNGLVLYFDDTIVPTKYKSKSFVVEGVGQAIQLVAFNDLVCPEPNVKLNTVPFDPISVSYSSGRYDEPYQGPADPEYITMNRSTLDMNAWARHNRWFHIDVILKSAEYNSTIPVLDQGIRARRPIIEFDPNLQLINNGRIGKRPVTHIDSTIGRAFRRVQHQELLAVNGYELNLGDRILFINDQDLLVRSQIYIVDYVIYDEPSYLRRYNIGAGTISVTEGTVTVVGTNTLFKNELKIGGLLYADGEVLLGIIDSVMSNTRAQLRSPSPIEVVNVGIGYKSPRITLVLSADPTDSLLEFDSVVAVAGVNKGNTFWFNGTDWTMSQLKLTKNQLPLFDVYDDNDVSFSSYNGSNFSGSKVFSYKPGSGQNDVVLEFPVSYTSNTTIAELTFDNNFGSDSFSYLRGTTTTLLRLDTGYVRKNIDRYNFSTSNTWSTVSEPSKQYQIISTIYTGRTNYFDIDILPLTRKITPTIKVFLNNTLLDSTQYNPNVTVGKKNAVLIPANYLTVGDKIDILIFSNLPSSLGYYQIPVNLDYNSQNTLFSTLTLGQLRNHFVEIGQNLSNIIGSVPGDSNLRDLSTAGYAGNILQHSAPAIYPNLFLIHKQANFVSGVNYARREYTKFKNKFIEFVGTLNGLDPNNPKDGVDKVLLAINDVKNKTFPWYYSDMVPYGYCDTIKYIVTNLDQRQYKLNKLFADTVLQNRAVLVYINNRLLTKGTDYTFSQDRPAIVLTDSLITVINDTIELRDYANTDANYIPETPTKLGLYPKYTPEIYTDNTYRTPVTVIQGHDGSLTPTYGDFRDDYLLELERRIYNNIKVDPTKQSLDIRSFIPGRFRESDYTLAEFNQIITSNFLTWIGQNKIDYISNSYFEGNDPFSYNYRFSRDRIFDKALPGYWRGIYKYFYDTDRPHTHPWEMLGFSEKPNWWDRSYGEAPYTSENALMWDDIESGKIKYGDHVGTYEEYARPGLSLVLPVNDQGELISPMARISTKFSSTSTNESFQVGDVGPVEAAWRRTSEYPYALQLAASLMKPALYFGTLFDVNHYFKDKKFNQYQLLESKRRVSPDLFRINGESVDNAIARVGGYTNWVVDYMTGLGINGTQSLRNLLSNLQVQLAYKIAGYTDKKYLTVLAEQYSPTSTNQSIIVPDDSYNIYLNKSVPVETAVYSAVILEKTESGFSVSGYDINNPYFTIVPSDPAGDSYSVKVENLSAVIYKQYRRQKLVIPYGQEFKTRQQVTDFLVSYQRYLFAQGFLFDEYDSDLAQVKDWVLSVKEFLTWTLQGWKAGSILVLSPVNATLTLLTSDSVVDEITNDTNGSKLLDLNFATIRTTDITVLRDVNRFKLDTISNQTIAFAKLNLIQFEHVLIFDNATVFNDIIYKPESGSRQFRLKLVGNKTAEWNGALSPPGFIYNNSQVDSWRTGTDYRKGDIVVYKDQYYVAVQDIIASDTFNLNLWKLIDKNSVKTGLLPNFANSAARFIDIYDADKSLLDKQMARLSSGLIGFRPRTYFDELNIDHTSQTKFYQGYIKDKGTRSAITSLLTANFNSMRNDISYFEEWGVRVGEYGATKTNQVVELVVDEALNVNNPTGIVILDDGELAINGMVSIMDSDLWERPNNNLPVRLINRDQTVSQENDLQTAGYVNINDVDATLFDSSNYKMLDNTINEISSGYIVWVAKDHNKDWNVYRASETDTSITKIEYILDNVGKVTTVEMHGLTTSQTVVVKNFDNRFDGFYTITSVTDLRSFTVALSTTQIGLVKQKPVTGNGVLFALYSVRVRAPSEIVNVTPRHGWKDGDLFWADRNEKDLWAVYQKNDVWNYEAPLGIQLGSYRDGSNYGTTVKIDDRNRFVVVGAPGDVDGSGRLHVFSNKQKLKEKGVLQSGISDTVGLGKSIDLANGILVAGAPDSRLFTGLVLVYSYVRGAYFSVTQVITNPVTASGAKFGTSLSQSKDANWLYIGSPGTNSLHVYKLSPYTFKSEVFALDALSTGCQLSYTPNDPNSIAVYVSGNLLVYEQDYNIVGNTIYFVTLLITEDYFTINAENSTQAFGTETTATLEGQIVINQRSYYQYKTSVVGGSGIDQFGYVVRCSRDGKEIIVGAPGANVGNVVQAGKTYVYKSDAAESPTLQLITTLEATNPVYRARYGTSVDICTNSCSIYVGAPGYSDLNYAGGLVHWYVNTGKVLGTLVGLVVAPVVTAGHSIYINGVQVVFGGGGLASIIDDITNQHITGITARESEGKILIHSNVVIPYRKLTIWPGLGTALANLGIVLYEIAQELKKPLQTQGENFGSYVKIGPDAEMLVVSSTRGTVDTLTVIDTKKTTLDGNATRCLDITFGSGAVYSHDLLKNSIRDINRYGNFVFSQGFNAPSLKVGDQFGSSVDFNGTQLFIGAAYNDSRQENSGEVYSYTNPTTTKGWNKLREQQPIVDITCINSISLHNKKTKTKLASLDILDPNKGKSLGIAEQDLNYKQSRDPAIYNAGTLLTNQLEIDYHWGSAQVGQTWWNLDMVRYVDYEQDTLIYRLKNWGKLFPGSDVAIYEWIESLVLPSGYVASGKTGTPLHANDLAYVTHNYVDTDTGIIKNKYYFWVRGLIVAPLASAQRSSIALIEEAIRNPKTQNIPYAAILSDQSISLYNCTRFFTGNSTILKIDYDSVPNENLIHSEFQLVQEDDPNSVMPVRIVSKLVDSLSGMDASSRRVPDPSIRPSQAIGLELRPRQTLVVDRYAALKNIAQFVNSIFASTTIAYKLQNSLKFKNSAFFAADPMPDSSQYQQKVLNLEELGYTKKTVGERILVESDSHNYNLWALYEVLGGGNLNLIQNQSYDTSKLWTYTDWYKSDYDSSTKPNHIVNDYKDIKQLNLVAGDVVKINSSVTGGFEIYRYETPTTAVLVAVQNGTIKLVDAFWDHSSNAVGFDNHSFDGITFDHTYAIELRNILLGLQRDIFVDELEGNYNKLLFVIIRYLLSEQQNVDWIFKTSFISVLHKIKELKPYSTYARDNHSYYQDYINEVKPYRTKIREYRVGYDGMDIALAATSDFDLPGYYDRDLKRYRSPSGELPSKDGALLLLPEYRDWAQNFTYGIDSILITRPGLSYNKPPIITILANGDGGTGATAECFIGPTGSIIRINVIKSGKGYRNQPYIVINGDGIGATAYAILTNNKIRSINTVLKFDRVAYGTTVKEWQANIAYTTGSLVSHDGSGYRAVINIGASALFNSGSFEKITGKDYTSAADRIAATYYPGPSQIPREVDIDGNINLSRVMPGATSLEDVITGSGLADTNLSGTFGYTNIASTRPEDINVSGGMFYSANKSYAPEELVPGKTQDNISIYVATKEVTLPTGNILVGGNTWIYRISKDSDNTTLYSVVGQSTTLAANLLYNDTEIVLSDISIVSMPNIPGRIPGYLYINGERIQYWQVDVTNSTIKQVNRGVDGTTVPVAHYSGDIVENQSFQSVIPDTSTLNREQFILNKLVPVYTTYFAVTATNLEEIESSLKVYYRLTTKMTSGVDYTVRVLPNKHLEITIVNANNFPDSSPFVVRYSTDVIWLNPGQSGAITDGTGLTGSVITSADFLKAYRH